eukprot:4578358-Alexandrium_andersonii.AAC.1
MRACVCACATGHAVRGCPTSLLRCATIGVGVHSRSCMQVRAMCVKPGPNQFNPRGRVASQQHPFKGSPSAWRRGAD